VVQGFQRGKEVLRVERKDIQYLVTAHSRV
jgi:hypothetical protein